jgi:hypothetical protein
MKVVLIIATKDEQDLESGHKRKKAGDIIAVCPYPHEGGRVTRKTHLLVPVDLGSTITTIEDAKKLMIPQYETGELWYPEDETGLKIVARNRYKIPLTELTTKAQLLDVAIDMKKVEDDKVDYQPLEDKTLTIANLVQDKHLDKKISATELTAIKNYGK